EIHTRIHPKTLGRIVCKLYIQQMAPSGARYKQCHALVIIEHKKCEEISARAGIPFGQMPTIDILEDIIATEKKKQAAAEKSKRQKRGTDSEGFTLPPKRHTSRLPNDAADAESDQEMAPRAVTQKPPKIPPIFIKCRSDWRDTLSILRAEVDDPINAQISGQFVQNQRSI
ncbi:hypothetical protein CDAR_196931, partial [Caerostris darwini]